MPNYVYEAINDLGESITGEVEAENEELANQMLSNQNLVPIKLEITTRASQLSFLDRFQSIKATELILFTKQIRTMLRSGVPIVQILQIMEQQTEVPLLKATANTMYKDILDGESLSDAFTKHKKIFSNLYLSMVRAG
ncbi:type II secretion system F family protein, partial [Desulfobacterales bacterium HSG17]|nr:type II secretion system F family protein [Desulfobacterales bacterium HSG17]